MARAAPQIDAFGAGGFRLNGMRHEGSLMILRDVAGPWVVTDPVEVTPAALKAVLAAGREQAELLLLGMGQRNRLPSREVREAFLAAGIGLEFMDTGAAVRLYNLLTGEGRRLAAAFIAV